jgi:hypothetical protein
MGRVHLLALAVSMTALAGCSDATGSVRGGEPLTIDPCQDHTGSTWTDLYACYFGPAGRASCGGVGGCHGSPADYGSTYGFICGATQESCYKGFTGYLKDAFTGDSGTPAKSAQLTAGNLRVVVNGQLVPGTGAMPCNIQFESDGGLDGLNACRVGLGDMYNFSSDDMARIQAWIDEGALNN